jgi:predicted histidine transporter YuiF (NhaC family)
MKLLILLSFAGIVLSLASGLGALLRASPDDRRLLHSLTLRIGLSIALFLLLLVGAVMGWWRPHQLS